jgi:hypothetical protein
MAPVETERQQKIDEQLSSYSATGNLNDSNEHYKYAQYKVGAITRIAEILIRLSADPPSRFLGAPERGQSG